MHDVPLTRTAAVETLRATFDATEPLTVGVEEEVLLVDPRGVDPVPLAAEVVARASTRSVVEELPACQVELVTPPCGSVAEVVQQLADARRRLVVACGEDARPMCSALHPWADEADPTPGRDRSAQMAADYGRVARRQLVSSLQVHVALGSADVALRVHDELRAHLPWLAALGAAAPFHLGTDTGLASARPLVCGQLPRQGIPPALRSWERYADELAWGARAGAVADVGRWWWELRPHARLGTLEVRVLDVQPTLRAAAALVAVVRALVAQVSERARAGRLPDPAPGWRIAENRWSALRHGVGPGGTMADLVTGEVRPTADVVADHLRSLEGWDEGGLLAGAWELLDRPTPQRIRAEGLAGIVDHTCVAFAPGG